MRTAGSITVYLSLTLAVTMSLFLALLESARGYGLKTQSQTECELLLESEMAAYHPLLQEKYHLYFLEAGAQGTFTLTGIENDMKELGDENLMEQNFYGLQLSEAWVDTYELALDYHAASYRKQAAEYMKGKLLTDGVQSLYEKAFQTEHMQEETGSVEDRMNQANEKIEAQSQSPAKADAAAEPPPVTEAPAINQEQTAQAGTIENPLDYVKELKTESILSLVLENSSTVSQSALEKEDDIEKRQCMQGNEEEGADCQIMEDLLFREYLLQEFGNYVSTREDAVLQYQQEYFIAGKYSDEENLEAIAEELIGIRELANFVYLQGDAEKKALAESMALAIGGVTANPVIVAVIKEGILAAWAFTESIKDVRTLLKGGKISLVKNSGDWGLDVSDVSGSFEQQTESASDEKGMDYQAYLRVLMYLKKVNTLSMRSLNLIEKDIRSNPGEEQFRMDYMIAQMKMTCIYTPQTLFSKVLPETWNQNGSYYLKAQKQFAYYK